MYAFDLFASERFAFESVCRFLLAGLVVTVKITMDPDILLYDWRLNYYFFFKSTSTRTTTPPFQNDRVLGIMNMPHIVFVCDSMGISLTLAYSFRICCSMTSSYMILTSLLLYLFKAHRHALQNLLFKMAVSWES